MESLKGKDLLTLNELSKDEIFYLLSKALELKILRNLREPHHFLRDRTVALIFEKPSTRTRVSFEVGLSHLGAYPLFLEAQTLQLSRGETLEDMGAVLSRYVDGIVIRTFAQKRVEDLAKAAQVPVINGLSDDFHPCQILVDLLTILEKKAKLDGLKLAYLGDGNNVAQTLLIGAAKVGMDVVVVTPQGYGPKEEIVELAVKERQPGTTVAVSNDPEEAERADVLYTDVWVSMGQEKNSDTKSRFMPYQLNERLVSLAKPDCLIIHCLPPHLGEEITNEVMDGPNSVVLDQAENRLHVQKALLVSVIGEKE